MCQKQKRRMSKDLYYLEIAKTVSLRSTCLKANFGSVIVKDDKILGTGYNGSARGVVNCCDKGVCNREVKDKRIPGVYTDCLAVHAEVNAIINSGGREKCLNSLIYVNYSFIDLPDDHKRYHADIAFPVSFPCRFCVREIINCGVEWIVVIDKSLDKIKRYNVPQYTEKGVFGL